MKLDIFTHIYPPALHRRLLASPRAAGTVRRLYGVKGLTDLDTRFRVMDRFGDYRQIISLPGPPLELVDDPAGARELARIANDGLAALAALHPDRFAGFVAALPLDDTEAMLAEAVRAMDELGAVGVLLPTNNRGRPVTDPLTLPIFDLIAARDRPLWLHPERDVAHPDYLAETRSRHETWFVLGWPEETSAAMAQIVFAELFVRHPGLKVIAHQMGGVVPFLEGRIAGAWDRLGTRTLDPEELALRVRLPRSPVEYFRLFHGDTSVAGSLAAMRCGLSFFGPERVVFASDCPFGGGDGAAYLEGAIAAIERLELTPAERADVYAGNARRLLGWGG